MKAESTIRKEMRRLRGFIDANKLDARWHRQVDEAYAMATALQWVLERTDWTPCTVAASKRWDT
jgi:hypothetical protein